MTLKELLKIKVVTSALNSQELQNSPGVMTVFSREAIDGLAARNLEDILNFVPGFTVGKSVDIGFHKNLNSRGSFSLLSDNVLVLLNGQKLNDALSGGAFTFLTDYPLTNVKQIEVVRGSGSALYGANAFMAVINIITYCPEEFEGGKFSASAGNQNSQNFEFTYSRELSSDLDFNIGASYINYDFNDINLLTFEQYTSPNKDHPRYFKFDNRQSFFSNRQLTLLSDVKYKAFNFHYFYSNSLSYNSFYHGYTDEYSAKQYMNKSEPYFTLFGADYKLDISEDVCISTFANMRFTENEVFVRNYAAAPLQVTDKPLHYASSNYFVYDWNSTAFNWDLNLDYNINNDHNLIFGLSFQFDKTERTYDKTQNIFKANGLDIDSVISGYFTLENGVSAYDRNIFAAFTQYAVNINKDLSLYTGIRADVYSDFGTSINPRIALVYKPFDLFHIKSQYSQAFKSPNLKDLNRILVKYYLPNPNLKAEKINNFELQFLFLPVDIFNISATGLAYHINDVIISESTQKPEAPNEIQLKNKGLQTTFGLELEFRYFPMEELTIVGNYTYYDSKEKLNTIEREIRGIAKQALNLVVSLDLTEHLQSVISLNSRMDFVGLDPINLYSDQFPDLKLYDKLAIPDYYLLNIHLKYHDLIDNFNVSFAVYNLLNQDNYSVSSHSFSPGGLPGNPRNFMIKAEYSF